MTTPFKYSVTATLSLRALHAAFDALRERSAAGLSTDELDALHEQVKAVTRDLKADGLLPERIIVIVRRIATDTDLSPMLLNRVVLWSVEEYYAGPNA